MDACCYVNHALKAIYIHLPKCGGLYIKNILSIYYGFKPVRFSREEHDLFNENKNHKKQNEIGEKFKRVLHLRNKGFVRYHLCDEFELNPLWKEYYKFTFIRNPYDRIVSAFTFLQTKPELSGIDDDTNFKETLLYSRDVCDDYEYLHMFISQYAHLVNDDGKIDIQFLGRFESLNIDLLQVLHNLGVTKITHHNHLEKNIVINGSSKSNSGSYVDFYDEESIEFVNENFNDEFLHLGYKKYSTVDEMALDAHKYLVTPAKIISENNELLIQINNNSTQPKLDNSVPNLNKDSLTEEGEAQALQNRHQYILENLFRHATVVITDDTKPR
jgi:hypothetical protein